MSTEKKPLEVITGTKSVYPHAMNFSSAEHLRELAERHGEGKFYTTQAAIIFYAFSLEAFLNRIGSCELKCWDQIERSMSTEAKIWLLCEHLGVGLNKGKEPFQTLKKLISYRNLVAHGKDETVKFENHEIAGEANKYKLVKTKIEKGCTLEFAIKARDAVHDFACRMQSASKAKLGASGMPFAISGRASGYITRAPD